MKIIKSIRYFKKVQQNTNHKDMVTYIALGFFDGVHLGHQKLLGYCVKKAKETQAVSTVILFDPHPEKVVYHLNHFFLLTTLSERIQRIKNMGIQQIITMDFADKFQKISAENFIIQILLGQFNMGAVFVGKNYQFGYQKKGDIILLEKLAQLYHFKTYIMDLKKLNRNQEISSTMIKDRIKKGDIEKANQLLGYFYQLNGEVIHGDKRGHSILSFPTANLNIPQDKLLPKNGVYICLAHIEGKKYQGLMNIGNRPTFMRKDYTTSVEMNVFDFHDDIYGKKISISLIQRIRDEIRFPNSESLLLQIKKDETIARSFFKHFDFASQNNH